MLSRDLLFCNQNIQAFTFTTFLFKLEKRLHFDDFNHYYIFFRNGSIHSGKHGSSVDDEIRLGLLNATCNAVANKQKQQQMILTQNHHQEQQQRKVLVVDDSDTPRFEIKETHT